MTMNTATQINNYLAEYQQHSDIFAAQPQWLNEKRQAELKKFAETGFPTTRDEDWKYTNLNLLTQQTFKLAKKNSAISFEAIKPYLIHDLHCHRLVFVDGFFSNELSHTLEEDNIFLSNIEKTLVNNSQLIENSFNKISSQQHNSFVALNNALFTDGAIIHLKENNKVTHPIYLLFINTEAATQSFVTTRNLMIAEANSSATIIENYVSLDANTHFTNSIMEMDLHDSANIEHYKIQQENNKTIHMGFTYTKQTQHSYLKSHSFAFGGQLTRSDTTCYLAAEHTECHLHGLYLANGRQHIDHHTYIDHRFAHGTSRENYKGIIHDHGRAVFNGQVKVHLDAQKTDAQQSNKNLLLSDNAEIDTKPQLEIYADDVKCAHGATVGQLDANALFYLRSRGLPLNDAKHLLTYAFAHELIEKVSHPALQNYLQTLVNKKLADYE